MAAFGQVEQFTGQVVQPGHLAGEINVSNQIDGNAARFARGCAMNEPVPHPSDRDVRILFVFATLTTGREGAELRLLAQQLDPARYRVDAVVCFQPEGRRRRSYRALRDAGVAVDTVPFDLSFDDTVAYLERKMAGCDIVVACQNVPDVYPALERMKIRPVLVEHGRQVAEAVAGPKHFTARYVATNDRVRTAAASRMPNRPYAAVEIRSILDLGPATLRAALRRGAPVPFSISVVANHWKRLFDALLAERVPAPPPGVFKSYFQGGFESSTHRLGSGRRLDIIASSGHDSNALGDYRQLAEHGIRTVRDALRWHLIEPSPGRYDFSSFRCMAKDAKTAGTQVIWDLMHYGWPDDLDIWGAAFVDRFARFAAAAARNHRDMTDEVPFWCPVNEISFFSWGGGDVGYLNPFARGRGFELKVQLARASIAAMHELRAVDPRARFVHCEPAIAISWDPARGRPYGEAEGWHQAQFQAFELISGRMWPQIGGDASFLDIVGLNYYSNNQWVHAGPPVDIDSPFYRPLSDLIFENHARYGRPVLISETGIENDRRASWFRYVAAETARARQRGVPVEGVCLYPVLDHLGWDDDRLCHNGLLWHQPVEGRRDVHAPLAQALAEWTKVVTGVGGTQPALRAAHGV